MYERKEVAETKKTKIGKAVELEGIAIEFLKFNAQITGEKLSDSFRKVLCSILTDKVINN